jgi:hypothetical protein
MDRARALKQSIRFQRCLPVIDVRDDAKLRVNSIAMKAPLCGVPRFWVNRLRSCHSERSRGISNRDIQQASFQKQADVKRLVRVSLFFFLHLEVSAERKSDTATLAKLHRTMRDARRKHESGSERCRAPWRHAIRARNQIADAALYPAARAVPLPLRPRQHCEL